ncbi:PRELI domain containing protein 3A isoform X2 [Dermacentor andersoni]|uniref:PRELI domain containing protein 3A isoform X2 n=1 Tax=Dermacentor andersoni TaxID=34620 RepID=UPI00241669CB|nr:PRELI domain containing protein 3B-like isoform X2 [Dermacentor andersoni]
MKIWTSEHTFNHPWETVAQAAWRKYPNPMNPAVVGIDVVDRQVHNGVLKSHRLISTAWGFPTWAQRILGADRTCYASEHSVVDPARRTMTMLSRNLTFCNEISIVEKLTYTEHPQHKGNTLMTQEAVITIRGVPLSSYLEDFVAKAISSNAGKVPGYFLCGDSCRENADLCGSGYEHNVTGVWDNMVHIRARCVPQANTIYMKWSSC